MKKFISLMLSVMLIFVLTEPALATENNNNVVNENQDEQEIAASIYNSLSPEAKLIFEQTISSNPELLEFHKKYVDKSFVVNPVKVTTIGESKVTGPAAILAAELAKLSLPVDVTYSLNAMGAGMVAAIADGPLPVGDIVLAATTASAIVVLAANWNDVVSKWSKIVDAFEIAFKESATNVVKAFKKIRTKVNKKLKTKPCITIAGKTITVNGIKYRCVTRAEDLTSEQKKNNKYFPAVLYNKRVYVDAFHPVPLGVAQVFMRANNDKIGIWATAKKYARGLCGGENAKFHNVHDLKEGYFFHYHHPIYDEFHCWFLD